MIRGIFQLGELFEVVGLSLLIFQKESKMEGRVLAVVQGSESVVEVAGKWKRLMRGIQPWTAKQA